MCDSKIVIAHVVLSLRPGGLENGVVNVINGLDRNRFLSKVFCLQTKGEFSARIRSEGVEVSEFGLKRGNDITLPFRLARALKSANADIVHTRNPEAFFYGAIAAKIAGIKAVVHSEHGRDFPDKPHRMWLQRLLTKRISAVFAMSKDLRGDLVKIVGLPAEKVSVIYNGVDDRFFDFSAPKDLRTSLGAPTGFLIGTVGRLAEVKNQSLLIKSVESLQKQGIPAALLVVGDGPLRSSLELDAQVRLSPGSYLFAGFKNDVLPYLQAMDVFVLPSRNEGISNTLLEAMACARPVVACNVGGNIEIVNHGENGILIENNNQFQLSEQLVRLYEQREWRERLAKSGLAFARNRHSMRAMLDQYETLYLNVCKQTKQAN